MTDPRLGKLKSMSESLIGKLPRMIRPAKQLIGLDIGSRLIKMVQIKRLKRGWQLVDVQVIDVPNETGEKIQNRRDRAEETALKRLIDKTGKRGAEVAVSISGPSVMVKKIDVPLMSEEELEGHLEWEVERYLPYERADIYWDYHVPHRDAPSPSSSMTAYLVAAKKEVVDRKVELVRQVGLRPVIVDLDNVALMNMYTLNYEDSGQVPVLLVNISPSGISMMAMGIHECMYMQDASIGEEWSQEVLEEGIRCVRNDGISKKESSTQTKVLDVLLQGIYGEIANEIRRIVDACHSYEKGQCVQRMLLCGGYAHLPGLVDNLSLQLRMPVEVVDPFKKFTVAPTTNDKENFEALSPLAGVAVGLALRGAQEP